MSRLRNTVKRIFLGVFSHGLLCGQSVVNLEIGATLFEYEVWRFLSQAVEEGRCSVHGATAIQSHLDVAGCPTALEEAWAIQGLTPNERDWLIHSAKWRNWVVQSNQRPNRPTPHSTISVTSQHGFGLNSHREIHELRATGGGGRLRLRLEESIRAGGSWTRSHRNWVLVAGDHAVGWGHGLTLPRADMFGFALFLGDAEMRLSSSPRGLTHAELTGALSGLAVEHNANSYRVGFTTGINHLGALIQKSWLEQDWSVTFFRQENSMSIGTEWSKVNGPMNAQFALAFSNAGKFIQGSMRWAKSRSWVGQLAMNAEEVDGTRSSAIRGYSTWLDPNSGRGVQCRVRYQKEETLDLRLKSIPAKGEEWSWSLTAGQESTLAGIHLQSPNVRGSFWFGRVVGGGWTSARHVEGTWKYRERWAMGLVAMEGQGGVTGAYAMVPNLDGRIWSLVPREGGRMGIWFSQKKSNRSWVSQWTWSPSQQETFRCALRWRWEGEPNRGILPRR